MKRTLILVLVLIVAVTAIAAPQQRRGPGAGPGASDRGPGRELLPPALLADFLDLTEAQIAQIEALRDARQDSTQALREQMRANHDQIEAALAAGDAAKAGQLMLVNYNLRQQVKAARDTFRTAVEALLTPAQKAKFAIYEEIVELRQERRGEGRN